jgi:hypothetical protein
VADRTDDLSGIPADERPAIQRVVVRLEERRQRPLPAFRGDLRRRLEADATAWRPRHLRRLIAIYTACGVALLGAAGASALGHGPLAGPGESAAVATTD